jgi:hypothetical protein
LRFALLQASAASASPSMTPLAASRSPLLHALDGVVEGGIPPAPEVEKDSIRFSTGIPPVSASYGSIRLFREPTTLPSSDPSSHSSLSLVCMVAVPLSMSASDVCLFLGPHLDAVTSVHALRDARSSSGSYMALILFRDDATASAFFTAYNGRLFSTLDNQVHALPCPRSSPLITSLYHYAGLSCGVCVRGVLRWQEQREF